MATMIVQRSSLYVVVNEKDFIDLWMGLFSESVENNTLPPYAEIKDNGQYLTLLHDNRDTISCDRVLRIYKPNQYPALVHAAIVRVNRNYWIDTTVCELNKEQIEALRSLQECSWKKELIANNHN